MGRDSNAMPTRLLAPAARAANRFRAVSTLSPRGAALAFSFGPLTQGVAMSTRFEALETRRMLSASLKGGVLRVSGTGGDDRIKLSLDAGRIVVTTNGVRDGQFLGAVVRKISLNAGAGDDSVSMSARITVAALLDGAAGDDVLIAAAGNDTLVGGAGDDVLRGMAGNDRLQPGNGENVVDGGRDGDDTVDYSSFTTGMWITLSSQYAFSEFDDAHNDTFHSIESADGTQARDH